MGRPKYPTEIPGDGLVLRPWTMPLIQQMARWSEHGFPYHAFDLAHLADPMQAAMALARAQEDGKHRLFVACEGETAVGRVAVNLDDEAGLYIWAVHVPPEHTGRGVARRMLAALMAWLEGEYPGRDFVLTSNCFAENAHRTYRALGFEVAETRWHYDKELAAKLWRVSAKEREPVARYLRFQSGRWQVRAYIFRRRSGTPAVLPTAAAS